MKVLHSICQQIWKTQQWSQDWKSSVFIPIPKKDSVKECSSYHTIALISQASKFMLNILQMRVQQSVNQELPDVQAGFRKCRGTRDQITNICWRCPNGPGKSNKNEDRTRNLVQWVKRPAASIGLRWRIHSESSFYS